MTEELLYEGKAKKVYATGEEDVLVHRYKDDATAFDGQKRGSWKDKGKTNATMSATIFAYLEREPAATFRTTISTGSIVSLFVFMMVSSSCSMKCVRMPRSSR